MLFSLLSCSPRTPKRVRDLQLYRPTSGTPSGREDRKMLPIFSATSVAALTANDLTSTEFPAEFPTGRFDVATGRNSVLSIARMHLLPFFNERAGKSAPYRRKSSTFQRRLAPPRSTASSGWVAGRG